VYDLVQEENNASNGFFSEQDGIGVVEKDCQIPSGLDYQFRRENNPKVFGF
jgi:hypothetical protein